MGEGRRQIEEARRKSKNVSRGLGGWRRTRQFLLENGKNRQKWTRLEKGEDDGKQKKRGNPKPREECWSGALGPFLLEKKRGGGKGKTFKDERS